MGYTADDLFSPNINILEKLEKMKIMETRMEINGEGNEDTKNREYR